MLLSRHYALVGLVPCYACRVPVGTPYSLSYCYHGIAPLWSLYRVICIASLSGRLIVSLAAITALRPVKLVPCYLYRVPAGTPYRLSYCYHTHVPIGTRPCITRYKRTKSSQCRDKTTNRPASRQGRDTKRTIECVMALQSFFGLSVRSSYPVG